MDGAGPRARRIVLPRSPQDSDPYYDYAIAMEYGGPSGGFHVLDAERLHWMHDLSKFINV
jgi:hypothetical protein